MRKEKVHVGVVTAWWGGESACRDLRHDMPVPLESQFVSTFL
jgi:hypothetical protein